MYLFSTSEGILMEPNWKYFTSTLRPWSVGKQTIKHVEHTKINNKQTVKHVEHTKINNKQTVEHVEHTKNEY